MPRAAVSARRCAGAGDRHAAEYAPGVDAAQQAAWDADPSPSWDESAAVCGIELSPTSPADPSMDVEWQVQAFWPAVPAVCEGD